MLAVGAVGTGVVVIVVAVAIVLVVFLVTATMRGQRNRQAEAHRDLGEAQERARHAEHEFDVAKGTDAAPPRDEQSRSPSDEQA